MEHSLKSLNPKIPDVDEMRRYGRSRRDVLSRSAQAQWNGKQRRFDPVELIIASNRDRLRHLVPIKMARMVASPFGFFRGAVPLMAADLASLPTSGLTMQICGDAHVRNLGAYAAPDGELIFDINDFDETTRGPWEWDVKRMAVSMILAGREAGASEECCKEAVHLLLHAYRRLVSELSKLPFLELERFYVRRDLRVEPVARVLQKARRATPLETLEKYTRQSRNGLPEFVEAKPLITRVPRGLVRQVLAALRGYRETLSAERQSLFDRHSPVDVVFKVVGTGSVGTRDFLVLLLGNGGNDPLFLQMKEEPPSAYTRYLKDPQKFVNEGRRVVEGQRCMQWQCDPLLGWTTMEGRDYLVRQFRDHKASVEIEGLEAEGFEDYARVCGELLAKGHSRSGNASALSGYLGSGDKIDKALAKFAFSYADQTSKDHARLNVAARSARIQVAKE